MWKILIIDDEAIIRESLKRFIDWNSIGAEVCGLAQNGSEALDIILDNPPDIILSDISMPMLTGIELIEFLRKKGIESEVIFISAYNDFEYARSALRYHAFDYILKPIEESLVLDSVKKCIQKIEASRKKESLIDSLSAGSSEKLKDLLIRCLCDYGYILSDADLTLLKNHNIITGNGSIFYTAGIWYAQNKLSSPNMYDYTKVEDSSLNSYLIDKIPKGDQFFCLTPESECSLYMYISTSTDTKYAEEIFLSLLNELAVHDPQITASNIYLSAPHMSDTELKHLYTETALTYLLYRYQQNRQIYRFQNLQLKYSDCTELPPLSDLIQAVKNNELPSITSYLNETLLYLLTQNLIYDLDHVKFKFIEVIDSVIQQLEEYQLLNYLKTDTLTSKKSINARHTLDKVYETTQNILTNISLCFQQINEKSTTQLVRHALDHIHQNYGADITLADISAKLYVSSTYLSKIFSQEMELTFSKYVTEYRIKMSKEFLKNPKYKIYEIANLCGFSDVAHFSKTFKLITGETPKKYRNSRSIPYQ